MSHAEYLFFFLFPRFDSDIGLFPIACTLSQLRVSLRALTFPTLRRHCVRERHPLEGAARKLRAKTFNTCVSLSLFTPNASARVSVSASRCAANQAHHADEKKMEMTLCAHCHRLRARIYLPPWEKALYLYSQKQSVMLARMDKWIW